MGKTLKGIESMTRSADEIILAHLVGKHKKEFQSECEKEKRNSMHKIELRTIIVIETCTLIEALANLYLALKCDAELFTSLENVRLLEKWCSIPRVFNPKYKLDKNTVLYMNLNNLIQRRNLIVHYKPAIVKSGVTIHKGKFPKKSNNEDKLILAFTQLPIQLLDNLKKYDDCMSVETAQVRGIINGPIFIRQIIRKHDKTKQERSPAK